MGRLQAARVSSIERYSADFLPDLYPTTDTDTLALERDLTNLLGLKVEIKFQGIGGTLVFHYSSLEQLDDILHRLSHGPQTAGGDAEMDDEIFEADPSTGGIPSDLLAAPLGSDDQKDQVANGHDENGPQKPFETLDTGAETHSDKD